MVDRHMRFGWWGLLLFLTLGIALEAMHGFKLGWYLDTDNTTRRHMLTLAHTHGTLLSLVNIAYALSVQAKPELTHDTASALLRAATALMPAGFFLGGLFIYQGDPGLGIFLVPVGAVALLAAVGITARRAQGS